MGETIMLGKKRPLVPLEDRGPLRVLFVITSMPVGGAETLLVNLIRRLDRAQCAPELCCLKQLGPLGEQLADEIPAHSPLLVGKYDVRVLPRLVRLIQRQRIDVVVTVGAGDKMFWGRLAAWLSRTPVVLAALHSTGWPDRVSRLNRLLTPITDGFIGVASAHGQYLVEDDRFPADKVHVIPNGVDSARFRRRPESRVRLRNECDIPLDAPVCGIVAALRPEKNHHLFLRAAAIVHQAIPQAHFVIVGDGPERESLTVAAQHARLDHRVHFLGTRDDVPDVLSMFDIFALTSRNEANPVSILEAMSVELPVVSTNVGSVSETIQHGVTGLLATPGAVDEIAEHWQSLLSDVNLAKRMGHAGRREVIERWSLERMVQGYEDLIREIYQRKCPTRSRNLSDLRGEHVELTIMK